MIVVPLHTHPLARAQRAEQAARLVADRLGLCHADREHLAAKTRALVRAGCSAAWAIATARRTARRTARSPETRA